MISTADQTCIWCCDDDDDDDDYNFQEAYPCSPQRIWYKPSTDRDDQNAVPLQLKACWPDRCCYLHNINGTSAVLPLAV